MKLAIYGSSGLGQEVLLIAKKINEKDSRWDEMIFIDDYESKIEKTGCKVFNFDNFKNNVAINECEVVIAVGEPSAREFLYNRVKDHCYKFTTLIHPNSCVNLIGSTVDIGCVVCFGAVITANTKIGKNVYIQSNSVLGHDVTVGDHCVLGCNSFIGGNTSVGKRSFTGFLSGIKEQVSIGDDVILAGGAMVFNDIPNEGVVIGNPGRIYKKNTEHKVFK